MKLLLIYISILGLNLAFSGVIALALKAIYRKNLTYKIYLWLLPGIVVVVSNAAFQQFMGGLDSLMTVILVIVIGVAIMIANFVIVGRFLIKQLSLVSTGISDAANKVNSASGMITTSNQVLAEDTAEHASALEETSSSLEEMSSMTRQNADNAAHAKELTAKVKMVVDSVDTQMHRMVTAIQEVTSSSEETAKIIKTIDEIAFQTNILALNAAVEAARAGEAGAGFAVVADEVRNLARRAAEAAQTTSSLIEKTILTVKNSRDLTEQTQNAFKKNIEISNKVGQLIDEIAFASNEQAQGIVQIGRAVVEMDRVVQHTAASTAEVADASQQMNEESVNLVDQIATLTRLIYGKSTVGSVDYPLQRI